MRFTISDTDIIKGSLVNLKHTCGKKGCKCYRGEKHISLYISRSRKGKTVMLYIPKSKEKYVKECVKRYKDILKKLDQFSANAIEKIKMK